MSSLKQERTIASRGTSANALTARPVKGPVDFAAMRRDIKAKFSKTLAHLAK
jgi:hypothetical protein